MTGSLHLVCFHTCLPTVYLPLDRGSFVKLNLSLSESLIFSVTIRMTSRLLTKPHFPLFSMYTWIGVFFSPGYSYNCPSFSFSAHLRKAFPAHPGLSSTSITLPYFIFFTAATASNLTIFSLLGDDLVG